MTFNTIKEAISDLRAGRPVIVLDDHDRENEGDLLIAAQFAEPDVINFMAREARGLICVAMTGKALDRLNIPLMVTGKHKNARFGSPFTVTVEARSGVTTGISAYDRSRTIKVLVDPTSTATDIVMPGHVFPLRAHPYGVLARRGHTEAGVDLTTLAGPVPAAVICEIMRSDGQMARRPELESLAERHDLVIVTVAEIIDYRFQHENLVEEVASARLPTQWGEFRVAAFKSMVDPAEHVALVKGDMSGDEPVLVRVHSECLTGDAFGSLRPTEPAGGSQSISNTFLFAGENGESENGLVYLRARYYDTASGRFISKDITGFRDGPNQYIYVLNNPINAVDPSGDVAQFLVGAVVGAALSFVDVGEDGISFKIPTPQKFIIDTVVGAATAGLSSLKA
ncbi:MAG: 3,4-dihydroxy-2-butanone-4-phosphate synthase, partial [Acidobacteria bacterium]|nr:3,4-dihydroxy-2-butanone-4-phosphate synthase [Acidobacteriota bacterium]